MKTKYWLAFTLLATMLVACSDLEVAATSTATNVPATATPTTTPLPPTATIAPTATAIPLVWKQISDGQEFTRDKIIAFEIDPKDQNALYVSMENAGYYQSSDGGTSWSPVQIENVPADISLKLTANNNHNQNEGYTITNMGSDGVERIYAYWSDRIVSENNGQSWSEEFHMGMPPSAAIAFDSEGSVYTYCNSSLCKSSPDGKQRVKLGKPEVGAFTIIAISPHDPNTIYVAGEGIAVSKNAGLTWTKINKGLGAILFLTLKTGTGNPSTLYLQLSECIEADRTHTSRNNPNPEPGQPLYISNNGGQTWELAIQTGCYLIIDADGVTLYRSGQSLEYFEGATDWTVWLWRSSDMGKTWQKVKSPAFVGTLTADLAQSGLLYIKNGGGTGASYEQYVSKDYGNKWREKDLPTDIKLCYGSTLQFIDKYRPIAIDPFDGNHVFVIDNGVLLESHNSCDSTSTFATPPNTSMNSIAFDPNKPDTLYAGTDGGAYTSFDSGKSWDQINDGLLDSLVVYSIAVDKDGNVYASTRDGIYQSRFKIIDNSNLEVRMNIEYCKHWSALILLPTMFVACFDSQVTMTATNIPATANLDQLKKTGG